MDGPGDCQSEWSKSKTHIICYHLYVGSKKKLYKWTYLQNIKRLTDLENKVVAARGKDVAGSDREFGMDMYTLLYI